MTDDEYTIDIISETGVPFRVVLGVRKHNGFACNNGNRVVSFYDRRYDFSEHGWFVSDYTPYTVLNRRGYGLLLDGNNPECRVGLDNMSLIIGWLELLVNHF